MVRLQCLPAASVARRTAVLLFGTATTLAMVPAAAGGALVPRLPMPTPAIAEFQFLTAGQTPPTEANCFAVGRRCFTPISMQNSYNLGPLYASHNEGQGMTIAIIDSFGNPNMASDLQVFDNQMGLPHMCGEPGATCGSGTPTFQHVYFDGKTIV